MYSGKTEVTLIKSKEFIGPLKSIKLDEKVLSYVITAKCLGFKIDHKLTWDRHITDLATNMSIKLKHLTLRF